MKYNTILLLLICSTLISCKNLDGEFKSGLKKKDFLNHVKTIHNGIALPKSYLNRPPWYEWIFFYSDEAEEIFTSINIS